MLDWRLCHVSADLAHANSVVVAQETEEDSFEKDGATVLCQNEQNFIIFGFWLKVTVVCLCIMNSKYVSKIVADLILLMSSTLRCLIINYEFAIVHFALWRFFVHGQFLHFYFNDFILVIACLYFLCTLFLSAPCYKLNLPFDKKGISDSDLKFHWFQRKCRSFVCIRPPLNRMMTPDCG